MKNPAPCKDCNARRAGCHAECDAYRAFRSRNLTPNAESRKKNVLRNYTSENIFRCRAQAPSGKRHVKAR